METAASPTSLKQTHTPNSSPKPAKKSCVASLRSPSFKEDTYFISHLKNSERKALKELKDKLTASRGADSMWGIPLLGNADDRADVVLLKFLRARDFRVQDALNMLLEGSVAYMDGFDRCGHPVCYNAYGVFKYKEMYEKVFGDEEKLKKFLRWRVQILERGIKLLHFKPGGVNSIIQITDLKDMLKRELRATSHSLSISG
ncbi:hypothetical protein SASPL_141207 [Salvia splendens]|uniref:CRAL/TRIO N-terminal domain-containing protein n=1 Tax=Salvia splendens TaxID=180675 RepID=A0A8X8WRU0_SALSN|nr:hypothetical protein SASPL_141207 [Salvia splendens]